MSDGLLLREIANDLVPDYSSCFEWGDIWQRPLIRGTALEWVTLAALISEARLRGWQCTFPIIELPKGSSLFTLRNELPRQHGAQAGHSALARHPQSLASRFLQAFTPKVVLNKGDQYYSIFREGCSYHEVMCGIAYDERPDILILPGRPTLDFPRLLQNNGYIEFSFDFPEDLVISGELRVVDSIRPVIRRCSPQRGLELPITGLIECSVNKTAEVATNQLQVYTQIFAASLVPSMILVTGNDLSSLQYPNAVIHLVSNDRDALKREFSSAARLALDRFMII